MWSITSHCQKSIFPPSDGEGAEFDLMEGDVSGQ